VGGADEKTPDGDVCVPAWRGDVGDGFGRCQAE